MSKTLGYYDSVNSIKGIGEKKAERLKVLGVTTVADLLNHFPYKYKDKRSQVISTRATEDKDVLVVGALKRVSSRPIGGRRTLVECTFIDEGGTYSAVFFNRPYLKQQFKVGAEYTIYGRVKIRNGYRSWANPEVAELGSEQDKRGIVPVYRCTQGLTNNDFNKWIKIALDETEFDSDWIDYRILEADNICDREFAYSNIHFPASESHYKTARFRIVYEQLLIYQLAIRLNRKDIDDSAVDSSIEDVDIKPFIDKLPFKLTDGQMSCISELEHDLIQSKTMNRLVQGDVGCGKTVVAETAIYKCVKSGLQAAMMAPTEILARQHFERLERDFEPYGIRCRLLVSGMKAADRRTVLEEIENGDCDVIIGTHAIIQDDVKYRSLGLVITDEQHRFGVNQRKALVQKGRGVNVCVMSATPIPRTLAATVFGDMDFSIIRNKPANRLEIITKVVDANSRERAYIAVKDEIDKGHQAYIIAPSIDSEDDDMSSVEQLYEELRAKFKGYKVGLIHGRLDKADKEAIMNDFAAGKIDMLVATVVIEVGIDVPNATIIVLENSERYGLAQMHQLRGRVGRSGHQSYCYLVNYSRSETAVDRANAMVRISDGFEISEEDYRLRGPGDIMGTMQSGNYQSAILSLCRYSEILDMAIKDAERILEEPEGTDLEFARNYIASITDNSRIL
ncbi:MAG: ATP-dependent DNA helicase RecG [Clostridiales bacterium]|nr:ATP-dependent DNA helicase RecG [Candidatus Crickella equi]